MFVSVNFPRKNKNGNPLKRTPGDATVSKLRSSMKFDLEFYEFAKQRFINAFNNFQK